MSEGGQHGAGRADKIGAKGAKIRCKKCGHVIVVRPNGAAAPKDEGSSSASAPEAAAAASQSRGPGIPAQQQAPAVIQLHIEDDPGLTCWPKDLDLLVEGVETGTPDYKLKLLRRIPRDPFNLSNDENDAHGWLLRSSTDDPESNGGWNRQNVFDVASSSKSQALDGSYYKEW